MHIDTDLISTEYKGEPEAVKADRKNINLFPRTPMSIVVDGALQLMADNSKNSTCNI